MCENYNYYILIIRDINKKYNTLST